MKFHIVVLIILASLMLVVSVSAIKCPLCAGKVVEYCDVEINPMERLYNEELTINVSLVYKGVAKPIDSNTNFEIQFYNSDSEIERVKFRTDETGIIKYTPTMVGYHLIKTCEKSILIYVNSTCGDGVCGGGEDRDACAEDCGKCGDGVCDSNENLECPDCAVCGDDICSGGETRSNCLDDCVFCGDGICDYLEDCSVCPEDCPYGEADGYCDGKDDGICDPDCDEDGDPDCKVPEPVIEENVTGYVPETSYDDENLITLLIIGGSLAIAAFIVMLIIVKFKGMGKVKEPKKEKKSKKKSAPKAQEDITE